MIESNQFGLIARVASGLAAATLTGAILYTLVSYGVSLFIPYFLLVLAVAAVFAVFLLLPNFVVLKLVGRPALPWLVIAMFAWTLLVLSLWNLYGLFQATELVERGVTMVSGGKPTLAGFMLVLRDGLVTAVIAAAATAVFCLVLPRETKLGSM